MLRTDTIDKQGKEVIKVDSGTLQTETIEVQGKDVIKVAITGADATLTYLRVLNAGFTTMKDAKDGNSTE